MTTHITVKRILQTQCIVPFNLFPCPTHTHTHTILSCFRTVSSVIQPCRFNLVNPSGVSFRPNSASSGDTQLNEINRKLRADGNTSEVKDIPFYARRLRANVSPEWRVTDFLLLLFFYDIKRRTVFFCFYVHLSRSNYVV